MRQESNTSFDLRENYEKANRKVRKNRKKAKEEWIKINLLSSTNILHQKAVKRNTASLRPSRRSVSPRQMPYQTLNGMSLP
ncbi:hypothetical protein DPMN_090364 [Dreissena polymorpha]|uniref:Uncharacterized protein n=1 Tax=Dreissena polymorpha TaxID=45954 RepID=A0A9D4QYZ9_DREPO|nr:hypothetical protein DPMN_090364 [Dreissena polymorpha]